MVNLREDILKNQITYYNGLIAKHQQNVEIYLNQPVGIGEHSDVMAAIETEITAIAQAHEKIEIINQQIKEIGFEKTSLKYNESLLKDNQGDLGWVNSKSLSKSIIDAIKYLNTGEISKPIITGNSILLLKVVNKRRLKLDDKNMDNLKKNILNRKRNQLFFLYSNSHLSKLKNLSVINYQ